MSATPSDEAAGDLARSRSARAQSFGATASSYHRARPGYPREAAEWVLGTEPLSALEVGAGTGKFTSEVVALGHQVHASDPEPRMLEGLARRMPGVRTSVGPAEKIDAPSDAYDVVVAAQCLHLCEPQATLAEVVRVLRPGGRLAVVANEWDLRVPWVKRLSRLLHDLGLTITPPDVADQTAAALTDSMKFVMAEVETFKHWHPIDRRHLSALVRSWSQVAVLSAADQDAVVAEVEAFYDSYGRGTAGMQLPYVTHAVRARVVKPRTAVTGRVTRPAAIVGPRRPSAGLPTPAPAPSRPSASPTPPPAAPTVPKPAPRSAPPPRPPAEPATRPTPGFRISETVTLDAPRPEYRNPLRPLPKVDLGIVSDTGEMPQSTVPVEEPFSPKPSAAPAAAQEPTARDQTPGDHTSAGTRRPPQAPPGTDGEILIDFR